MARRTLTRTLAAFLPKPQNGGISIFPPQIDFGPICVGYSYNVPLALAMTPGSLEEKFIDMCLFRNDLVDLGTVCQIF